MNVTKEMVEKITEELDFKFDAIEINTEMKTGVINLFGFKILIVNPKQIEKFEGKLKEAIIHEILHFKLGHMDNYEKDFIKVKDFFKVDDYKALKFLNLLNDAEVEHTMREMGYRLQEGDEATINKLLTIRKKVLG